MRHVILHLLLLSGLWKTASATLSVPSLVSPATGASGLAPNVLLDWSSVGGANSYEYRLATQPGLSLQPATSVLSSQAIQGDLFFGTTYYWQVRAVASSPVPDSSAWSAVWSFTTTDELYPVSPSNGAINLSSSLIIDWSPLSGATYYEYQYDSDPQFTMPFSGNIFATVSQAGLSGLLTGSTYHWRVRAFHAVDTSGWSAIWNFTVGLPTGINSINSASTFFYPNPSYHYVYLESPAESGTLSVLNVSGNKMLEWELRSSCDRFDVSALEPGCYILQYQHDSENKRA
ncbi:MAG: T9SS type A sorting domain-containing protein [Bacteroidota bacterium]